MVVKGAYVQHETIAWTNADQLPMGSMGIYVQIISYTNILSINCISKCCLKNVGHFCLRSLVFRQQIRKYWQRFSHCHHATYYSNIEPSMFDPGSGINTCNIPYWQCVVFVGKEHVCSDVHAWYFLHIGYGKRLTYNKTPQKNNQKEVCSSENTPDSKVHGPTWGPSGAYRTQVGPM